MKKMPVGISDFGELIINKFYYIDKTLLVKDLLDNGSKVNLIARPRRFGKTINMSMLKYYFDKSEEDNSMLFENLAISKYPEYKQYQGKYPVIFITLKDVKCNTWDETYNKLQIIIQSEFIKFKYLMSSDKLEIEEKEYINKMLKLNSNKATFEDSLAKLTYFLYKHHNMKPILLIDEYDVPIQSGFINKFYDDIISFMRNWLSGGLKDNTYLEFAVLTGILRVAKESIFSGLNNLEVSTLLDNRYNQYFGFTENNIQQMTIDFSCEDKLSEIKEWYDGYNFAGLEIYNPWSVINYFKNNFVPQAYWLNTSSNDIIHDFIKLADNNTKQNLEVLLKGKEIESIINTDIVYNDIYKSPDNLYSYLLLTGYLKTIRKEQIIDEDYYTLAIPNKEIRTVYKKEIISQLAGGASKQTMYDLLRALLNKDTTKFKNMFQDLVLKTLSYIDSSESFYHGLMLGIVALLVDTHYVKSNRESGYGRFDVMLIPKDKTLQGIILEFKATDKKEDLHSKAKEALQQIDHRKYETELQELGIKEIYKYGVAFCGKDIEMISE